MVESGEISRQRIDESYRRIMNFKKRLTLDDRAAFYQQQAEKSNQALVNTKTELKSAEEKIKVLEANAAPEPTKKRKRKNK
jgi:hypothetical protein